MFYRCQVFRALTRLVDIKGRDRIGIYHELTRVADNPTVVMQPTAVMSDGERVNPSSLSTLRLPTVRSRGDGSFDRILNSFVIQCSRVFPLDHSMAANSLTIMEHLSSCNSDLSYANMSFP